MESYIFSAPGRTEIGGNHTDHQHGCVLAAAVDLETTAAVTRTEDRTIRVTSEGYAPFTVSLDDLAIREEERGTSAALVRGIAAAFVRRGAVPGGVDMTVRSQVLPGSGLSSSAAFEVLVAAVLNELFFDGRLDAVELARIGQWAENVYFGKPCGLMDQMACAVGGAIFIDLAQPDAPVVKKIPFDLQAAGYALCIIDTGADHAGLTAEYAAITEELRALCACFDKTYLREISEADFMRALPRLRGQVPDRALLRAMHVYRENARVTAQAAALQNGGMKTFLRLVGESGRSSWMYLQNITPTGATEHQPVAYALALCDAFLHGQGAFRIHGGGFAGTVQAYVPLDRLAEFQSNMEKNLGKGCCHVLDICPHGGVRVR